MQQSFEKQQWKLWTASGSTSLTDGAQNCSGAFTNTLPHCARGLKTCISRPQHLLPCQIQNKTAFLPFPPAPLEASIVIAFAAVSALCARADQHALTRPIIFLHIVPGAFVTICSAEGELSYSHGLETRTDQPS
jgi:hypothetical protein